MTNLKPALLKPRQTAEYLGIALSTLWRYRQRPDFPNFVQLGPNRIAYRVSDLDKFIENNLID